MLKTRRKTAYALGENILYFVQKVGLANVGFFTITFDSSIMPREAQRRMNNFARRVLKGLFGERVRVSEFTRAGRIHYHLVVDCLGDVRTGFDWGHYERTRAWSRDRKRRLCDKPRGNLGRTSLLRDLHLRLNAAAGAYHIGRIELVPLKSTGEAVGRYVGGYIAKGEAHHVKARHKGLRWVNYTRRAARIVGPGPWGWGVPGRTWRRKLERWAAKHGCASLDEVRAVFGARWAWHGRDAIAATDPDIELPSPALRPVPHGMPGRVYVISQRAYPETHWQRPLVFDG